MVYEFNEYSTIIAVETWNILRILKLKKKRKKEKKSYELKRPEKNSWIREQDDIQCEAFHNVPDHSIEFKTQGGYTYGCSFI